MEIDISQEEYEIIKGWYFSNDGEAFGTEIDNKLMLKFSEKFKDNVIIEHLTTHL